MNLEGVKRRHLRVDDVIWYYLRECGSPSHLCGPYKVLNGSGTLLVYCGTKEATEPGVSDAPFQFNYKMSRILREIRKEPAP